MDFRQKEFTTTKGSFVAVEGVGEEFGMELSHKVISGQWFVSIERITEEQASQIVEEHERGYKNYTFRPHKKGGQQVSVVVRPYYRNALDSFYSLLDKEEINFKNLYIFKK